MPWMQELNGLILIWDIFSDFDLIGWTFDSTRMVCSGHERTIILLVT